MRKSYFRQEGLLLAVICEEGEEATVAVWMRGLWICGVREGLREGLREELREELREGLRKD